jgi:hypothetical protein
MVLREDSPWCELTTSASVQAQSQAVAFGLTGAGEFESRPRHQNSC